MAKAPSHILIIGGGIAGVSTAYYSAIHALRSPSTKITIVEGTSIAAAASGKSGGFLAKDWHGSATASLAAMSYELHEELAREFGGAEKWGFRTVDTLSIDYDATRKSKRSRPLPWLIEGTIHSSRSLGGKSTTAQVHPGLFTKHLSEQLLSKPSTSIIHGTVTSLSLSSTGVGDGEDKVQSVSIELPTGETKEIEVDTVVIAAGPWTGKLSEELLGKTIGGRLAVSGHRAHSVVLKTKEQLSAHCLFTSMAMKDGSAGEPEVYTRPDGTTYICGAGDDEPLPKTASEVTASPEAIAKLHKQASALSPVFSTNNTKPGGEGAEIVAEQACFLPIADRGRPLVGKVRGVQGVYVGSGLSCWGITQGPGTGKVLSELIFDGMAKSADISKLAP